MSDLPERIWAESDEFESEGYWHTYGNDPSYKKVPSITEYIRADVAKAQQDELLSALKCTVTMVDELRFPLTVKTANEIIAKAEGTGR